MINDLGYKWVSVVEAEFDDDEIVVHLSLAVAPSHDEAERLAIKANLLMDRVRKYHRDLEQHLTEWKHAHPAPDFKPRRGRPTLEMEQELAEEKKIYKAWRQAYDTELKAFYDNSFPKMDREEQLFYQFLREYCEGIWEGGVSVTSLPYVEHNELAELTKSR
jgi:hypothetical protein